MDVDLERKSAESRSTTRVVAQWLSHLSRSQNLEKAPCLSIRHWVLKAKAGMVDRQGQVRSNKNPNKFLCLCLFRKEVG